MDVSIVEESRWLERQCGKMGGRDSSERRLFSATAIGSGCGSDRLQIMAAPSMWQVRWRSDYPAVHA